MHKRDSKKELDEAIKPLRDVQVEFRIELDEGIKSLRDTQEEFRKELDEVKNIIETRVLPPLVYIETTLKSYADRYVTNEDHIGRLDKRLNTIEENLGI